ncbi:MAG: DMT family transporter [Conexivisphaerales archaeon]
MLSKHSAAILAASFVTFLWSTSFILIKYGLSQIPAISFAAYRYSIASAILIAAASFSKKSSASISRRDFALLLAMGLTGYSLAQGLQFVGLSLLSTDTTAFLQNTTPVFVLALSYSFSRERPLTIQVIGLLVTLAGLTSFFWGSQLKFEASGVMIVLIGSFAWAVYLILLRISRVHEKMGYLRFTAISMGLGSLLMLIPSLISEGITNLNSEAWLILIWLAVINTAFAFYLWNLSSKVLSAFELSVLQNTMLVQIALLSWLFLGEGLSLPMAVGMVLILVGSGLVQLPEAGIIRKRHSTK